MNTKAITLKVLIYTGLLLVGAYAMQSVRSERRLVNLLTEGISAPQHGYDPAKEPARKERAWRLHQLWTARSRRDITAQAVPFLNDEYAVLRNNAVRLLGRSESRLAEQHLQRIFTAMQQHSIEKPVSLEVLRIALARNRSRGLKGRAKIAAFAKGVGLSFDEAVRLTGKVHSARANANGSTGQKIVREMVDMLYVMANKGENITSVTQQLTLFPAQKLLLQGAGLPSDQEAKLCVEYLAGLNVVTPWDGELTDVYLPPLGTHVTKAVVRRLRAAEGGRVPLGREGRSVLFDALRWNGSKEALQLLRPLENSKDDGIREFSRATLQQLQLLGKWSSPLSPRPPTMSLVLE